MSTSHWVLTALFGAVVAFALGRVSVTLFRNYGFALFFAVPFAAGFLATALLAAFRRVSLGNSVWHALTASAFLAFGCIVTLWEGLICIVLSAPLAIVAAVSGSMTAYALFHRRRAPRPMFPALVVAAICLASPVTETRLLDREPAFEVSDSIDITAAPARVWQVIVTLDRLPEPDDWVLRSGVACPQSVEIKGRGEGALRVCRLSTGVMPERITSWEANRLLAWRALATPPPMREVNPLGEVDPPHLHGYWEVLEGSFQLTPLEGGRTRLTRRTLYRHRLEPAAYWRVFTDHMASRAHRFVLREVQRQAEVSTIPSG